MKTRETMQNMQSGSVLPADSRKIQDPVEVLRRIYGYSSFRGQQADVVDHVMKGGDAVVLFPTGAGKSLCFQIPALCRDGVGIKEN